MRLELHPDEIATGTRSELKTGDSRLIFGAHLASPRTVGVQCSGDPSKKKEELHDPYGCSARCVSIDNKVGVTLMQMVE